MHGGDRLLRLFGGVMPIYVYECAVCDVQVEELCARERADDPVECPLCHALCGRVLSVFAVGHRGSSEVVSGEVPRSVHGMGCSCCTFQRR